jgi:2-hydroxychromene-2-carboxylate isomerase
VKVTQHAGVDGGEQPQDHPAFYFDLASPEAYLAAERVLQVMPVATEWIPVLARDLPAPGRLDDPERIAQWEATGAERGMQAFRWPAPLPFDSELGMLAATYAKQIGRIVAFALAAFRQAYAAARPMSDADNVVIAGSACEMHPTALLKAATLKSTRATLAEATALAARRGVRDVPAIWVPGIAGEPDAVFHGDRELERAAEAAGA